MLTVNQIKGTRAKPTLVAGNGVVVLFAIGDCPVAFSGAMLHFGIDGKLYAVFPDGDTAMTYAAYFPSCRIACFGNSDNAYLIDTVH